MLSGIRRGALRLSPPRTSQCRCYSEGTLDHPGQWVEGTDWIDVQKVRGDKYDPFHGSMRIFSGIQPTGVPHLGNYLGALQQWKRLHDNSAKKGEGGKTTPKQYFSVVDLHALTSEAPAPDRLRLRKESYASLLAIGLKNTHQTTLFFQSDVCSSYIWCTSCLTNPVGTPSL